MAFKETLRWNYIPRIQVMIDKEKSHLKFLNVSKERFAFFETLSDAPYAENGNARAD